MGLFRKSAYLASGGIVAPNSRKQRTALQTLAAAQGASPAQVRRTGGRGDYDSFLTGRPAAPTGRPVGMTASGRVPVRRLTAEQAAAEQQAANDAYEANRQAMKDRYK